MQIIESKAKEVKEVKIQLYVKDMKTKDGKRSFKQFHTYMNLVKDENKGKEVCWIQVKFTQAVPQDDVKKLTAGFIYVPSDKISAPKERYAIKKDEDGKDIYPCVWIKEVTKFEPYVANTEQDQFSDDADHKRQKALKDEGQAKEVETNVEGTNVLTIDPSELVDKL